jgi:hypothetical protein
MTSTLPLVRGQRMVYTVFREREVADDDRDDGDSSRIWKFRTRDRTPASTWNLLTNTAPGVATFRLVSDQPHRLQTVNEDGVARKSLPRRR